jgi:hypothetical protein
VSAMSDFFSPKFASMQVWCALSGVSERASYDHIARGDLRAVRLGGALLVDVENGLAWIRTLPPPVIKGRQSTAEPALRRDRRDGVQNRKTSSHRPSTAA